MSRSWYETRLSPVPPVPAVLLIGRGGWPPGATRRWRRPQSAPGPGAVPCGLTERSHRNGHGSGGAMDEARAPTFGTLLKRHRLDAGLTQEALAERAGVSA